MGFAGHYFPSAGGNVPNSAHGPTKESRVVPAAWVSAETTLKSPNCQVFKWTMVCFYAYLDILEQSDGGLLKQEFFRTFPPFFWSFSRSLFIII